MSAVKRKVHRQERYRAKVKGKKVAELQGQGKAQAREGKAVNIRAALAFRKKSGKAVRELEALGVEALQTQLEEARKELFNLRFKHATGQLDRVSDLAANKKRIARILTLIRQKEVGA